MFLYIVSFLIFLVVTVSLYYISNDPKKSEMIQMIKKSNKIKNILEKNYFDYEPLILAK